MKQRIIIIAIAMVQIVTIHAQNPDWDVTSAVLETQAGYFKVTHLFENCHPTFLETDRYGFNFTKPIVGDSIVFKLTPIRLGCFYPETVRPGDISFKVFNTTKLILKGSNGNVGVNTTNPLRQLDVNGDIGAHNLFTINTSTDNVYTKKLFVNNPNAVPWEAIAEITVPHDETKAFVINNTSVAGAEKTVFNIYGNGVVNAKKIYAEEVEVTMNAMNIGWFDHVFAQDYKLMSLYDLEQFIKTNKHLPEIPSEKEVKENGINLGEMQGKLLLKIEELTLYIIELEKRLSELEAKKGGE